MYTDNARISHRQFFRQMILGLGGILLLLVPDRREIFGRQGVFCILTASGLLLLLCVFFIRVRAVFQKPEDYMGRLGGRIFIFLYLSWLWLAGVYLLLALAKITDRFLIEGSVSWAVILLSGLAAYLGSRQGLERRGRLAEVCFWPFLFILLAMLLMAAFQTEPDYLEELGSMSLKGWGAGTLQLLSVFLPFAFLPFTLGNVRRPAKAGRAMGGAILLLSGLLILALLLLQGSFGLGGYGHKAYPLFDLMAGVKLPGDFLERVDIFWIFAIAFSLLFSLGSVFFYSHELLVRAGLERGAFPAGAAVLLGALWCQERQVTLEELFSFSRQVFGPLFLLLLLWAGYAAGRRRSGLRAGKGRKALVVFLTVSALFLSGCGVSLEDRTFPLVLGADYQEGHYELTYGLPKLAQATGQDKEGGEEEQSQGGEEETYQGLTPKDAEGEFTRNQDKYLDMGHIKVLLLGERLLEDREALEEFLGYLEEKPSVAGNIYVLRTKDVPEILSLDTGTAGSVGEYITGILENTLDGGGENAATLQELYNAWHREEELPGLMEVTEMNRRPMIRQYSW